MTVLALSNALKNILTRAGVENPEGDCACIIHSILRLDRAGMIAHAEDEVDPEQADRAVAMAKRRSQGEPIQYVIGSWSFMGRDYLVGEGVLIPRDDTEVVVNAATDIIKDKHDAHIIDLCSGSGVIAITLKYSFPDAAVCAVEKSDEAFAYLVRNREHHGADIDLTHADIFDCADNFADSSFDLIISNPPYIPSEEIPTLQHEVSFEPVMALDGGISGYDFYDRLIPLWTSKLKKGGCIALEIGEEQVEHITALLQANGYEHIRSYLDIQDLPRAMTALKA